MFATLLAYQAHCARSDFRGKLACLLVHGSILSRIRAPTQSGAVQFSCSRYRLRFLGSIVTRDSISRRVFSSSFCSTSASGSTIR
ncbi:hypothetical protein CN645_22640 [Burkholderia sp. IDO3]|nr:hypothetical protein CN645_22640 [Burkholderia sp. IDO3]